MRLIDADNFLKSEIHRCGCVPLVGSCTNDNVSLKERLEQEPTIEAELVKRGEWESSEKLWETQTVRCSNCKAEMYVEDLCNVSDDSGMLPAFCPRCGCDMRGDEE